MSFELEAAHRQLAERLRTYQEQLDEVFGPGVHLEIDPSGLPKTERRLADFGTAALGAVCSALREAARDKSAAEYFRSRVAKVLVRNDESASTSRFDYELGRRLLVVITTPELKHWVDYLALQEFLRAEL